MPRSQERPASEEDKDAESEESAASAEESEEAMANHGEVTGGDGGRGATEGAMVNSYLR